ncbi:hypothetical protein G7054_g5267 [Neopestalotiopsis clavispora]|nr:hypothetical protein G7054_g5267 [Neopestalotiopsis clavispora]
MAQDREMNPPSLIGLARHLQLQREEQRKKYHSVSLSIHGRPHKELTHYSYEPPRLPSSYDAETTGYLVEARFIPPDGRIQLPFDFHWQIEEDQFENGGKNENLEDRLRDKAKSKVQSLNAFFGPEFSEFGRMIVWDINPSDLANYLAYDMLKEYPSLITSGFGETETSRKIRVIYPLESSDELAEIRSCIGEFAQRCEKMQRLGGAPWQRIVFCQGLPFASQDVGEDRNFPFLVYDRELWGDPIRRATNLHLSNGRIGGSKNTNPYSDPHSPFHVSFFEKLTEEYELGEPWMSVKETIEASRKKNLKIGYLYGRPQKGGNNSEDNQNLRAFRKSSFTMVATSSPNQEKSNPEVSLEGDYLWTILILSPSAFFPISSEGIPATIANTGVSFTSQQTAQLSFVLYALDKLEKQWTVLNEYIASLLVEDFMDPETYTKLLFDDEIFSRSRLYFWIIGCLNEFDLSIEDNIKQSKLFRQGRVEPLLNSLRPQSIPEPPDLTRLRDLDKRAEELEQGLEDIQAQFRAKIETVQSLREGLFNASALMESRSSTKLGQNVQLLTYVSIFYLPLGFCAALWAIPDITDSATKIPFVLTACVVGFVTYAIVFNLGNIAKVLGKVYVGYRAQILQHMENDENQSWQELRRQFEEFPPNQERQIPSEWWILRYQTHKLFSRRNRRKAAESGDA